jgi:2-polyprenyl-3-methyl-5-hydroxy-6-metoxy-1,4-benzoquinol methylase
MTKLSKSQNLYNSYAPFYGTYSTKRAKYNNAIDKIILKETRKASSILDVGCGNGKRGHNLAQKLKATKLFLVDNSKGMIKCCKKLKSKTIKSFLLDVSSCDFSKLGRFEVIVCLGNVIGHIENEQNRIKALINLNKALCPNGIIYFDVNNRYNLSAYGVLAVLKNILKDIVFPREENGNFDFSIDVGKEKIPASVHIFNPFEIEKIIKESGLKILKKYYVDYETGEIGKSFFTGQVLYKLTNEN